MSNKQIAKELKKSIRTVEGQVASILLEHNCSRLEYIARRVPSSFEQGRPQDELGEFERIGPEVLANLGNERESWLRHSELMSSSLLQRMSELPVAIESLVVRALAQKLPRDRQRLAILGLSRTGLAVATAAKAIGDDPILLEERSDFREQDVETITKALKVPLIRNWRGPIREIAPDLIVVPPGIPPQYSVIQEALQDGIPVLSEIEYAYRLSKAPIVAIGGANGKSTTAVMTYLMLRAAGLDGVLCGRIFGSGYEAAVLSDAAYKANPSQILVTAVKCADLDFVNEFHPKVAAMTNAYPDFFHRYENFGRYLKTMRRLFARLTAADTVVCNSGVAETFPSNSKKPKTLTWSPTVGDADADAFMTEDALLICGHRIAKRGLAFSEPENYMNALCAALLALGAGADRSDMGWILEGLGQFKGLTHRFEPVGTKNGVHFVNNSACSNPSALLHAASSARESLKLLVGGISKGPGFDKELQSALRRHRVYLYGLYAHRINEELGGQWPVHGQMQDAFSAAIADAVPGDTIMLAPGASSADQFSDFMDRGDTFRSLVTQFIEN